MAFYISPLIYARGQKKKHHPLWAAQSYYLKHREYPPHPRGSQSAIRYVRHLLHPDLAPARKLKALGSNIKFTHLFLSAGSHSLYACKAPVEAPVATAEKLTWFLMIALKTKIPGFAAGIQRQRFLRNYLRPCWRKLVISSELLGDTKASN